MLTIATAYRTGGDYDASYVHRLRAGVKCHLTTPHRFLCLTNEPSLHRNDPDCMPLHHDWPGWWCLIELYRLRGPIILFGLDTVIVGDFAPLARAVADLEPWGMIAARGWKRGNLSSQVVGYSGSRMGVYSRFRKCDPQFHRESWGWGATVQIDHRLERKFYRGDQDWLAKLQLVDPIWAQDVQPGIYSYKHHCQYDLPKDAAIVCFHGHPRPHEVKPRPDWLAESFQEASA